MGTSAEREIERLAEVTDPARDGDALEVAAVLLQDLRSEATLRAYAADLREWFAYCRRRGVAVLAARRIDFAAYGADMDSRKLADGTRRRRSSVIRGFYREALDVGALRGPSPAERARRRTEQTGRADQGQPALSLEEVVDLLAAPARRAGPGPAGTLRATRDRLVLRFLLLTALRSAELRAIRWQDMTREGERTVLRFAGKGGKPARVKLTDELVAEMTAYRAALEAAGIVPLGPDPIFLGLGRAYPPRIARKDGRLPPLSARALFDLVDGSLRVASRNGTRNGPHLLRRTSVTLVWQDTGDLALAQRHARHETPATTENHYIRPSDDLAETGIDHVRIGPPAASGTAAQE